MSLGTKILIISNNVLSPTRNNGKTILSFIEGIDKACVRQLYFNGESPSVEGYSYYQLSDHDVMRGICRKERRGRVWSSVLQKEATAPSAEKPIKVKPSSFLRLSRDILWHNRWKSAKLLQWLDEFQPDTVFFVAGDSGFAYNITGYIVKRYGARLVTYITDDYIMPRTKETLFDKLQRGRIRKKMLACIKNSQAYFTISALMQKTYQKLTGKPSQIIMNMTPPLYDESVVDPSAVQDKTVMLYAGSLYYGRDSIIGAVADAAVRYNSSKKPDQKAVQINIYSNATPQAESLRLFEREGCCAFCGSLSFSELKTAINQADVLLFVESFDEAMQEKTRYSLSTKVPEYMSARKPIFAVGPAQIGSMDYLADVAFCANTADEICDCMTHMLADPELQAQKVQAALDKYNKNHDVKKQKELFLASVQKAAPADVS